MSENIFCPKCKTSKYRNPSLRLLVNVCGHALCENCVDLLFAKGSGTCPKCNINLRRAAFRLQLFEDSLVEKDVDIRKRILKDFNKKEEDFNNLHEYNDYLEFVENIIFNLTNNINIESTKKKIEQYKKDNAESISRNRGRMSKDEELIEQLLEQEKEQEKWRNQMITEEERDLAKSKNLAKEALVDDLMFSDLPANQIIAQHANEKKILQQRQNQLPKPLVPPAHCTTFSTGIKVNKTSSVFLPVPKANEEQCYVYKKPDIKLNGPEMPDKEGIYSGGYLVHVRKVDPSEMAGGFLPIYPCYRALQEAFCGLYDPHTDDNVVTTDKLR